MYDICHIKYSMLVGVGPTQMESIRPTRNKSCGVRLSCDPESECVVDAEVEGGVFGRFGVGDQTGSLISNVSVLPQSLVLYPLTIHNVL